MSQSYKNPNQIFQPPITLNRQSQFYINAPLKLHSLKLRLRNRILKTTNQLYSQCNSCTTNQCLNKIQRKLKIFKQRKQELEGKINRLEKKFQQEYFLCRDLVFQNDIRLCRLETMNKYYEDFMVVVNQSRISNKVSDEMQLTILLKQQQSYKNKLKDYQFLFQQQLSQLLMKPVGKSFSTKPLQFLIGSFQDILIQKQILDKPRRVTNFHYCRSQPKVRKNPHLAGLSKSVLQMLGYDQEQVLSDQNTPFYLSGSKTIPGSVPVSHNYCGYQFGVWAGQLGDGRAHTLGNVINGNKIYQLQLKGSGLSPFSRHADGNSVVSSSVRQFLVSELMAGIGVPTTRALSLVITQEDVIRDPFYNGIIKVQNAAIVLRVAESFLRFGSFQVCKKGAQLDKGNQIENRKILTALADYLIKNFYPQIDDQNGDIYEQMFAKIVVKSAELVAYWQSIGFVHGVLNTDNMSMVNVTIDYGPFGFIDYFSKDFVSNATDQHQRYSYRQQPSVVKWNLTRLAEALDTLVPFNILKKYIDQNFDKTFEKTYNLKMAQKLGLQVSQESKKIVQQLFQVMHVCGSNFTNTFRRLSQQVNQQKMIDNLMLQTLPTQYFKRSLRIISNPNIPAAQIQLICTQDSGFNRSFLTQQAKRRSMLEKFLNQSCEQRTAREKKLWVKWLQKYQKLNPNKQKQKKHTIKYVLLNEVAKNITQELNTLKPEQQRKLLQKILQVFAKPYEHNEWFEQKYWSKRPVPVRLTCSS